MSIMLPPDLEAIVLERVAAGLGDSPESVLREAFQSFQTPADDPELIMLADKIILGMEQMERGEYMTDTDFEAYIREPLAPGEGA